MRKLLPILALLPVLALAQTYNYVNVGPSGQIEKSDGSPRLQPTTGSDIGGLFTGCTSSAPYLEYTGVCGAGGSGGGGGLSGPAVAIVPTDESRTSSTLTNDTNLTFTSLAAGTYKLDCTLSYYTSGAWTFVYALQSVTQQVLYWAYNTGGSLPTNGAQQYSVSSTTFSAPSNSGLGTIQISGIMNATSSGGSVTLMWASGSNGGSVTLRGRSSCTLQQV